MKLRTKLQLRVIFSPSLWWRLYRTDAEFDKWLWDAMEFGGLPEPTRVVPSSPISGFSQHYVQIAGQRVWIENAPFADVRLDDDTIGTRRCASRATALRFRDLIRKMKQPTDPLPDPFEVMYGDRL